MKRKPSRRERREFIRGVTLASIGSVVALNTTSRTAAQPRSGGAIVHPHEGQPGAIVYVPQGVWHGLRNNGKETLGMSAIYSPPGFEQAFKDRLLHPNRTPAEAEASRKKHGIVYRNPQR